MNKIAYLEEHFCYEFEMLLLWFKMSPLNQFQANIKLEITLTHARVIYDFFYKPRTNNEKNLKVTDFVENLEYRPTREKEDLEIWDFRHRCSSTLSHIWRDRDLTKYTIQDLSKILKKLIVVIERFLENLKDVEYDNFKNKIKELEEKLK